MKKRPIPYYDTTDCCDQDRVNGTPNALPSDFPTGLPTGPGGPFPGMQPGAAFDQGLLQQMQQPQTQHQQIPPPQMQQQFQPPAAGQLAPIPPSGQPQALTLQSVEYLNGFLKTQIGKMVRVEFLIGTGTLLDKSGTLLGVGANYIVLRQAMTDDILTCDFFSIKFITFYY